MIPAFRALLRLIIAGALLLIPVASAPNSVGARPDEAPGSLPIDIPTDQIIVKYNDTADVSGQNAPDAAARLQTLSAVAGAQLTYFRPMSGDAHVLRLPERLPTAEVDRIAGRLAALPDVEYAEADAIMLPTLTPNDPRYADQWHYFETYGINAPAAWNITTGSGSIVVAVIDTGITNHADLSGRTVAGYDFISNSSIANDGGGRDSDPSDPGDWITPAEASSGFFAGCPVTNSTWHGTHVAGTIGANSNNSVGVAGINWNSKIQAVRVLGKCGGLTSDIVDGMRWAAGLSVSGVPANANPAKVINMSLGGSGSCDSTYQNAINQINAAGKIVVVAAGNSNTNASNFRPANCNGVITVAATDRGGDKASYSNYGAVVEISAPGGETAVSGNGVLSTLNTGTQSPVADTYTYYQGTSMAAPHIAGIVSLMVSVNPTLVFTDTLSTLQSTAQAFPGGSSCNTSICGSGIADAAAALNALTFTPTDFVYLPLVSKNHSLPQDTIQNGDFESGHVAWAESSTNFGANLILNSGFPGGVSPHGGSWAVWLGGANNETGVISQTVTVPAGSSTLSYWNWIASEESLCGFDIARVRVNGGAVETVNLCDSTETGGWVQRSVDLSAYAGQTVSLEFRITTDGSLNSNWFLDDVAFGASPKWIGDDAAPGDAPDAATPRE